MTPDLEPVDRERYEAIVESIAITAPGAVVRDSIEVASTLVATFDRTVDRENGYTRTYGTDQYAPVTLYPSDVLAYSDQSAPDASERFYAERATRGRSDSLDVDRYAVTALALDLEEAVEGGDDR